MAIESLKQQLKMADNNLKKAIEHRIKMSNEGISLSENNYIIYTLGVDVLDVHLNGVLCLNKVNPKEVFNKAEDFFGNKSYRFWVRNHEDRELEEFLKTKGFKPARTPGSAGMRINSPITKEVEQIGYTLKTVETFEEVLDYKMVISDAFKISPEVSKVMYSKLGVLKSESIKAYVLYDGVKPVAAATVVLTGDVAGIYYLGVIKEKRGKGLGSYITKIATNSCFEMGAKSVILQASLAGESVYKELGYEVITHYRTYSLE